MMTRRASFDGFQLFSGVLALIAAPVMLGTGAPAGWSLLILAFGIVVLGAQAMTAFGIDIEIAGWMHVLALVLGSVCVVIAVVYLTRAADDLPRLFPGHDGDSEHFRVMPGIIAAAAGTVLLGRAVALAHPRRATV